MEPEHPGRRRLRGIDLAQVGAEDDDDVGNVGMVIGAECLLGRDDAFDDALAALGYLERMQLATETLDEVADFLGLDLAVGLAALEVEPDAPAPVVRDRDRLGVGRLERQGQ